MQSSLDNRAMRPKASPACPECKGTGKAVILGRQQSLRTGRPDVLELRCPVCGGSGKAGLRTK